MVLSEFELKHMLCWTIDEARRKASGFRQAFSAFDWREMTPKGRVRFRAVPFRERPAPLLATRSLERTARSPFVFRETKTAVLGKTWHFGGGVD